MTIRRLFKNRPRTISRKYECEAGEKHLDVNPNKKQAAGLVEKTYYDPETKEVKTAWIHP